MLIKTFELKKLIKNEAQRLLLKQLEKEINNYYLVHKHKPNKGDQK